MVMGVAMEMMVAMAGEEANDVHMCVFTAQHTNNMRCPRATVTQSPC